MHHAHKIKWNYDREEASAGPTLLEEPVNATAAIMEPTKPLNWNAVKNCKHRHTAQRL